MLIAIALALPCISWPFLWDDFDFLRRSLHLRLADLLPDPSVTFYRPISREVYFWVVNHLLGASPIAAHVMNAFVAAGCVFLIANLLLRTAGPRAAVYGALLLGSAAALPFVIGWTSGIQDLLSLGFLLLAFDLTIRNRGGWAVLALGAAILSKETAVVAAPALVPLLLRGPAKHGRGTLLTLIGTGSLLIGWAAIHPWTRGLLGLGPSLGRNEYVAFRGAQALESSLHGVMSVLNLTWDPHLSIRPGVVVVTVVASVLAVWTVRSLRRIGSSPTATPAFTYLDIVGMILVLGPLALTASLIGHWSPYYGLISVAGLALLAGPRLARMHSNVALGVVLLFLWAGVALRSSHLEPEVPAEHNLRTAAAVMTRVEAGFKASERDVPAGSHVYVLIQAAGEQGLYTMMYRYHPLRVWYRQPSLWVENPIYARGGAAHEYLFWISPDLDVYEVNLETLKPRGSGAPISFPEFQKTLRGYALGLAGSERVDRAVEVLTRMPQYSDTLAQFDRRTAAALLIASGRATDGQHLLKDMKPFDPAQKFWSIAGLVAKPPRGLDIDIATMVAFDTDPDDPRLNRELMRWLWKAGFRESALRFARRIGALVPGDPEAAKLLKSRPESSSREITVPALD